ncbi:MAG: six-cysteine ranthipeptide SCIFF [Oscillospiraceae bacterium]|jgi:predicted ribosomally synthesized six-cysteine peptide SCIFF|nr:six-cysteine ranthipeptide SCIFF [Oscillospiraceae bacterium]
MENVITVSDGSLKSTLKTGGCSECQASCQSACKTSCTVANQDCEKEGA